MTTQQLAVRNRQLDALTFHLRGFSLRCKATGPRDCQFGWVMDYAEIKVAFQPLLAQLDHQVLNEISGLGNPTAENLAVYIADQLVDKISYLSAVTVQESNTTGATVWV